MTIIYPRCHVMMTAVLDGRGGPDKTIMCDASPKSAQVGRNGYHDADTWTVTFDARVLPFDPDLLRSVAVGIYMYSADSMDDNSEACTPDREMVRGLADDAALELGEDGQTFTMTGRDYTGLLLDAEWDPKKKIPSGQTLRKTVEDICNAAAPPRSTQRFEVIWDVDRDPDTGLLPPEPIVGAAHRSTKKKGLWVKPGKSTWDVIYEMVQNTGYIVYVRGEEVRITDPNTQTRASASMAPQLVYGRDLQSLKMTRKLTKEKVPQIRISAFDPRLRQVVSVEWPEHGENIKEDGLGRKKDEIITYPAPRGVFDHDSLLRLAKIKHADLGRSEAVYVAETRFLETIDPETSILKFDAGSPVILGFDPFNSEVVRKMSVGERADYIASLGYSDQVANEIANHVELVDQFRQPHYTTMVDFSYGAEDGISITITGGNYSYEPRELAR